jgi:ArsR family transcriptional regulator, arsenate/arsenite/antimonite-responsive transcriptional repressor
MHDDGIVNNIWKIFDMYPRDTVEQMYIDASKILKALADPKRLRIVDMLSCGELCACVILESFHVTQPTLSHDMKVLIDADIVNTRRDSKYTYYSLRTDTLDEFHKQLGRMISPHDDCICHDAEKSYCRTDCYPKED